MKTCDLHAHSVFSDGTATPLELIEEAQRMGLAAVALTDHNTIAGLPDFLEAARGREVEAVPGVEFSTEFMGKELHILALFIRPEHYTPITELLEDAQRQKDESNAALVKKLNSLGYNIDYAAIKASTPNGSINRSHIAAELTKLGYTESMKDAFKRLLSQECGLYQPPRRIGACDCIRFIKSLGAVAVLAHPLLTMDPEQTRRFLEQAAPCGLDAMETAYVTYDAETTRIARELAEEFGLKHSGGSDFHGENKPGIQLGIGRGELSVPMQWLEELRK